MNKSFFTKCAFIFLSSVFALSSCTEKDVYQGEVKNKPLNPTEAFDFSLTKEVKLSIDYGFTNDYYILFQLYDQNPMIVEEDSWIKNEALTPIYSAATDTKGQYSGTITIPSSLTAVWLYSDYLGTVSPVELTVSNDAINYKQKDYIASLQAKTRAVTPGGFTYLDDNMLMPGVDWDQYGLPSNIELDLTMPPADILYSINAAYSKARDDKIPKKHPEWINENATSELKITKPTEVSLVFMKSGATWNNTVGYFTYPTNTVPTESTIKKILAFPNASPISKATGALLCGHEVKLQYWNEAEQKFESKFPAGVTLGWYLEGDAFRNGNIVEQSYARSTRYSYNSMNEKDKEGNLVQRVVALRHESTDQIVAIGFEDNEDYDYCDATFYLKIAEKGAIEGGGELPPVNPPSNVENTVIRKGTLTYEDQWPSEGDYDMNDVVVEYKSTLYRQIVGNKVYKIVDEFTPVHNGGTYSCGFGYQLHNIDPSRITSIDISGPSGSRVESDQPYRTIILFDDVRSVLGQTFTVTIEVQDADESLVTPPYNPFLFVNDRSREVHLVNYPPTEKADMDLFNTQDDVSNTASSIYYLARYEEEGINLMPFGINLPNVLDFNIPAEGVRIYKTYPDFIGWVKSNGSNNKDWYKK
ncbi:LruC domain-containing protein [Bacteroides sp. GD17]|uniref:LruC domain-containing protein n=1 Tax=Bacteroides sp. GD17 TaxID=3139826 RepID=UPI00313CB7A5